MLESMRSEKRGVALNSLLAAAAITLLKLVVGLSSRSLGILSEAAHSGLDLVAAFITFVSVRVSDKPADAEHQYGHGKVENFSAFIETGLLLLTCIWIVWEALRRLSGHHAVLIEPSLAAFAVLFTSMAVAIAETQAHCQQVRQPGPGSRRSPLQYGHLLERHCGAGPCARVGGTPL
jgi:cation diffusion facilitator family transporter